MEFVHMHGIPHTNTVLNIVVVDDHHSKQCEYLITNNTDHTKPNITTFSMCMYIFCNLYYIYGCVQYLLRPKCRSSICVCVCCSTATVFNGMSRPYSKQYRENFYIIGNLPFFCCIRMCNIKYSTA